jgi:hypothetical protein
MAISQKLISAMICGDKLNSLHVAFEAHIKYQHTLSSSGKANVMVSSSFEYDT